MTFDKTYNKILILGCPGSGKSTLGKYLQRSYDIPLYKMDDLYWEEDWRRPPDEFFVRKLAFLVEEEQWIIDGNYFNFLDVRLNRADLVFYLHSNPFTCLFRVIRRSFVSRFVSNESLPQAIRNSSNKFRVDLKFAGKIAFFNKRYKGKIFNKISEYGCKLIHVRAGKKKGGQNLDSGQIYYIFNMEREHMT